MSETKQMWQGGPLREWSNSRLKANWIMHGDGGYAGCYVCDRCQMPSDGLYRVQQASSTQATPLWVCGGCRNQVKPKGEQPEWLRKHQSGGRKA